MALILSHGKNGLWAISEGGIALAAPASAAEIQNAGNNTAFVRTEYSENAVSYFDDIVAAFSPDDLLSPLTRDGAINSARSITQKQLELARDTVIHTAVSTGLVPAAMPATNDGWGNGLLYTRNTVTVCGAAAGPNAFTLTSLAKIIRRRTRGLCPSRISRKRQHLLLYEKTHRSGDMSSG